MGFKICRVCFTQNIPSFGHERETSGSGGRKISFVKGDSSSDVKQPSETAGPHYAGKLRVRVCGLCRADDKLLLIRHKPFAQNNLGLWSPPGGGLQYGETLTAGLQREFLEETGLEVVVGPFLFLHEFIALPLHALEIYYAITVTGGTLRTGHDPELAPADQLIAEVSFKSLAEIQQLDKKQLHGILHNLTNLDELFRLAPP